MPEIHSLVIHFPIALLSSAILFDFLYVMSNDKDLAKVGWWVMLIGLISATAGMATGIWQDALIGHFGSTSPIWVNHGAVQIFSFLIFLVLFIWRTRRSSVLTHLRLRWVYLLVGIITITFLFYGGHLGAKIAGRM
jgi:uncharacterized membrane protein